MTPLVPPRPRGNAAPADTTMIWRMSHRADPPANVLAKRHYNCQTPDSSQYMPPGSCVCFITGEPANAVWGTSWPITEYVKHEWAGDWVNSIFRSENAGKASELIRQGVSATRHLYGEPPALGMVTFIDPLKVQPRKIRRRPTWGWTYLEAGFKHVGYTKGGLWAFQMLPADMPPAAAPIGAQLEMVGAA